MGTCAYPGSLQIMNLQTRKGEMSPRVLSKSQEAMGRLESGPGICQKAKRRQPKECFRSHVAVVAVADSLLMRLPVTSNSLQDT